MKILLIVAVMAMCYATANAVCKELDNCDTCSNPGPLCGSCPKETIMSSKKTSCLACGTGCSTCTADDKDKVTCLTCKPYNYLNKGACTECGEGCGECTLDKDGKTVKCSACLEKYGSKTDDKGVFSCIACSSNCKACSVNTKDDSTKCSTCYDYKGLAKTGYFLKNADSTCGGCPSSCESCSDNGNGAGICKSCYKNYVPIEDASDSTKSGLSCLKCPTDCTTCSGVQVGNVATCTACTADKALYISSGACTTCGTGAKTCSDKGVITACNDLYRLDIDTCTKCPAFCKSCPKDGNDVVSCATCDATYGPKPTKSITCDACSISACEKCERLTDGTGKVKCTQCKTGTALKSDTECATCPLPCKSGASCTYDSGTSKFKCSKCTDATYIDNPDKNTGQCSLCSTSDGGSDCSKCTYDTASTKVKCQECTFPKLIKTADDKCYANIDTKSTKCIVAASDHTACTTCKDGYAIDGAKCDPCTAANCKLCLKDTLDKCEKNQCVSPYVTYEKDTAGACKKCTEKVKYSGAEVEGMTNCEACEWATSTKLECTKCASGYLQKSDKLKCIKNVDTINGKCTVMADASDTECKTCADGYGPVKSQTICPKCNDANCKTCATETGSEKKCTTCNSIYITTDVNGGECKACPSKCIECTYDSTNKKTVCTNDKCSTKYAKNADTGACDACSEHCGTCQWDNTDKVVVCSTGGCSTGYGLLKAKTCGACPTNCDTCSRDTAPDADDTLYCDTCKNNYAKNADICAACPSNCEECADNKGTMDCSKCNDQYALDSKKACTKCPSNCNKCSASGTATKCTECKSGYSLSGDSTACTECATAAFAGCATCTETDSASGKANCTACAAGYTLEDGEGHKSCKDVSSLTCGAGTYTDAAAQCSACSSGFGITKSLMCAKKCYSCGDVDAGVYVEKAQCMIPANGANATASDAKEIDCLSGICYAVYQDKKIAAGCLPAKDSVGKCTGDRALGETCANTEKTQQCQRCCSTALCNTFVADLDGTPDSAITTAVNLLLLTVTVLLSIRFN